MSLWSLCASFYYIFKQKGPFYPDGKAKSVEIKNENQIIEDTEYVLPKTPVESAFVEQKKSNKKNTF